LSKSYISTLHTNNHHLSTTNMSFNKRTNSSKTYFGVYHTQNNTWITRLMNKGKMLSFGPFSTDLEAAKKYDEEVLKISPHRSRLNFPNDKQQTQSNAVRLRAIRKKFDKKLGKKRLSNGQKKKELYVREQFPLATRNLICARQKWKCNFCVDTLTDIFIIDHMVPLFLGGSNDTHNLQALCPSCDRFKTSYLDNKILKPIYESNGKITSNEVAKIQLDHYHQKTCKEPEDNDNDNDASEEIASDDLQKPKSKSKDIEIRVGQTLIRVSSLS